jgi:hypothetical protein
VADVGCWQFRYLLSRRSNMEVAGFALAGERGGDRIAVEDAAHPLFF